MDDCNNDKKTKGTKVYLIKIILKSNDYKDCLFKNEMILKSQQRFKVAAHSIYTERIDKIALVVTIIKDCKLLIELHHIHTAQMLE